MAVDGGRDHFRGDGAEPEVGIHAIEHGGTGAQLEVTS